MDATLAGNDAAVEADAALARRCLSGEVIAWEQLYVQCHERLLRSIRIMLGRSGGDSNLADEIAARVWYAVVAKDGERLARFNPKRGARLITFLRTLARDEIARHFRSEQRRRRHELAAMQERPQPRMSDPRPALDPMPEFLGTLTPEERGFCSNYLLAGIDGCDKTRSMANIWQLTHRVYRKLVQFLNA